MRLIDADELAQGLMKISDRMDCTASRLAKSFAKLMQDDMFAPTIDAAPVVHARWEDECDGYRNCSACGCEHPIRDARGYIVDDEYCPACGAKMDGGACNAAD